MKIYIAHISHEYSGSCIAALSEAERNKQVASWCRDFWEKDWRDLPKNDREVIEYYFEQHQEDEQLDEYEVEIPGILCIQDGSHIRLYQDFGLKGYKPDKSEMAFLGNFSARVTENGETYLERIWAGEERGKIIKVELV